MRRTTMSKAAATAVAAFVALAPNAFAGSSRRVQSAQYNYTTGVANPEGSQGQLSMGYALFETFESERKVSLTIADASGRPVFAAAKQDLDGDGKPDTTHEFCGSTPKPLPITGGVDLKIYVRAGACHDGTASVPTTGVVQATFRSGRS